MSPPGNNDTLPNMTPERWRQVKVIFERAVEVKAGEEREQYIRSACGNDTIMMCEVLSLLEADSGSGDLLERPLVDSLGPTIAPAASVIECSTCGLCLEQSAGAIVLKACPSDGAAMEKAFDGGAVIDGKFLVEMRLAFAVVWAPSIECGIWALPGGSR